MSQDTFHLESAVDFDSLERIKAEGNAFIAGLQGPQATFDLGNAAGCGSPAVALMVAWYRHCRLHETSILFTNVPGDLKNIIRVSGLKELLPVTADD